MSRMRPVRRSASAPPSQLPAELRRAASLVEAKQWDGARTLLEDLCRRYPNSRNAHFLLLEVARATGDGVLIEQTMEHIARLSPDDPDIQLSYAQVARVSGLLALAWKRYRSVLERWPEHKEATKVRYIVTALEAELSRTMDEAGLQGENRLEVGALNDEVQYLLQHGRYAQGRQVAQTILAEDPHFAPALNNISLSHFLEGDLTEAIATVRRVLEFDPENIHALGSLAHYLSLVGQEEEARLLAKRMKSSPAFAASKYIKEAQTLSFLADDAGVVEVYRRARAEKSSDAENALLLHLAAVALLRLGQEKEARGCWKQALKQEPDHPLAKPNLDDLRLPIGERNGPWPFTIAEWISRSSMDAFIAVLKRQGHKQVEDAAHAFLAQHPEITHAVSCLLERGDPVGRQYALELASMLRTPEMLEALRTFALSPHGPDALRMQAASIAMQAGLLESPIQFWIEGKQVETQPMGFEVTGEPTPSHHSAKVEGLVSRATVALRENDARRAETLLLEALKIEPDAPDVRNNLAAAYSMQGRTEESTQITLQLYEQHPDYFFARTNMAQLWLHQERPEEAEELIKPLMSRQRMHFSEFRALCMVQIKIALLRENIEGAQQWLRMWENTEPDHPQQKTWRQQIEMMRLRTLWPLKRRKRKAKTEEAP
jgi:tetratricopeptide (TPR) repeat protein